tara:strand:+ start:648 stop:1148 length:501 start_codon:yes stop_codon:yes gene_type:complete
MLKNFKSGYAVSGSDQTAKSEKNDCVVRAIANACDVNYSQAHKYVGEVFDRKKGDGVKYFQTIMDKTNMMRFDEVGQLNMFDEGIVRSIKSLGKMPKFGGDLCNPKYKHKPVAYTVKAFAQAFNKGKYIVAVNGHALAICAGVVMDNDNYQYGGYRRVVESAYQIQ